MSIPLVQEATKDAINTSIIAIKRNIERINMLLGLVDSGSPDLSGLATKQELEDAITQVETDLAPVDEVTSGNMQSVTSNAVAEKCLRFPDYAHRITINSEPWTATEDCFVMYAIIGAAKHELYIDNIEVSSWDSTSNIYVATFAGYVRKGQVVKSDNNYIPSADKFKAFPLI